MKIIKTLSVNLESFFKEFSTLISLLILTSYVKFFLYLFNYNDLLNPLNERKDFLISFFRYLTFSLSFTSILLILFLIILFIVSMIFRKIKFLYKKLVIITAFLLEVLSYIYIYTDLQIYKLMGVHIHNRIVLGALNKKDLDNDVALTSEKVLSFLKTPLITTGIILLILFLLIYLKTKFNLDNIFKKVSIILSIPIFLSLFIVMYFWINLYNELTAIPLWSYIESSHLTENFESNYGDGFDYDKIKIKNKMNVIIIIAESFRKDVLSKENTPNLFELMSRNKGNILSNNHFSSAHFTVISILGLWYSIWGYHYKAILNNKNYKDPIPIKVLNKLGYDTQFLTTSFIVPSLKEIKKATKTYKTYKTFENDLLMIDFFKNYYKNKDEKQLFFTAIFLNSSHYQYNFPDSIAKYKPYISINDKNLFNVSTSLKSNYAYKTKLINRYKNSVYYIDILFKKILDIISDEEKKNTIIVFIGDHGEQFWEHNYFGHTKTSYVKEAISVPLIFYIPDLEKNINVDVSSHVDIMTTLLSYITNITNGEINRFFDGVSLLNKKNLQNNYSIISSFKFMGLKDKIALINKYGKLILESKTNAIKDESLFKIIQFTDFNDKKLIDNTKREHLLEDFKKFKKSYLRFIEMDVK